MSLHLLRMRRNVNQNFFNDRKFFNATALRVTKPTTISRRYHILSLLLLPFSNAAVERVFSTMNIVKTKVRNRMQQDSLEKILHERAYMSRHKICSNKFLPDKIMLSLFTAEMYRQEDDDSMLDI